MESYSFREFFNPDFDYELSDEAPVTTKSGMLAFWSTFVIIAIFGR